MTASSNVRLAQQDQPDQGARLAMAIERVIRPFIRLIVGRVSCGFLVQQIRRIYIEEAREWITNNDSNGRVTKSKLAMLTGLDTRTIAAIEAQPADPEHCTIGEVCSEAGVLYRWISQPEYRDDDGQPRMLSILGKANSFQSLVSAAVGRNVTYQTVLERLLESGNVEIVDEDYVRLVNPYYQPVKASEQTIIDAGSFSIGRLAETIFNNLDSKAPENRLLQQDRLSRLIPRSALPELKTKSRKLLEQQILEHEQLIDSYETEDETKEKCVFGIGWFQFSK